MTVPSCQPPSELVVQLRDARAEVQSLVGRVAEPKKSCDEAQRGEVDVADALGEEQRQFAEKVAGKVKKHESTVEKLRAEAKSNADQLAGKRNGALSR